MFLLMRPFITEDEVFGTVVGQDNPCLKTPILAPDPNRKKNSRPLPPPPPCNIFTKNRAARLLIFIGNWRVKKKREREREDWKAKVLG